VDFRVLLGVVKRLRISTYIKDDFLKGRFLLRIFSSKQQGAALMPNCSAGIKFGLLFLRDAPEPAPRLA